jgi:hypothetical protein
MTTFNMSFA